MAEAPGLLLARKMRLDRIERAHGPVREPAVARRLVLAHLLLQVVPHPRHDQRMPIGGGDQREAAHARPLARLLRQQARLRVRLVEIFEDGERLEERRPALVEHERRHHALRVHREIVVGVLLALQEIDGDLFRLQALEGHRHTHAVGRERTPETVELHGITGRRR